MAKSILDDVFSGAGGVAKTLINLLGAGATMTKAPVIAYDPLLGTDAETPSDPVPVDVAVLEDVTEKDVDGTTVVMGDYKTILPKSDFELQRTDIQKAVLTLNGTAYRLIEYKPVYSGQEIAMYTIYVRRT